VPIFKGNTEIEQIDAISKYCGTPNENTWPMIKEMPWYSIMSFKEYPRTLSSEFKKLGMSSV
jgi:hypothetical protein